ncbi:MAG: hypothetical protein AMXMBFR20_34390 [Planctomycetia bacterium]|nr:hypothetical protein [Planctomycetota bacterium]OQY98851.1 MAG: hypothetical protein B6D36_17015 [Planctomycetes bacterium UTPLA1]
MAGAVPQQRGGSNATTIGMVVSIIVAVLLLGALIWLITQQEQLSQNADQAVAARVRINKELEDLKASAGLVVGAMTGDANEAPVSARNKLEASLAKIRDDGRVPAPEEMTATVGSVGVIDQLYQLYLGELDAKAKLMAGFDKANADLKDALAAHSDLQKKLADDLSKLKSKVDELQNAKTEFERIKSSETQALASQIGAKQDALNALRRESVDMRRKARDELLRRESLLDQQREALASLRGPGIDAGQELAIAQTPVGTVMRALPGDSLVHIDLGREDNVRLGMSFSVYSAEERIPADGRGKAHIEVVSVDRRTAECRVTTPPSPDNPILEGDSIGNIVLSRDRSKKQRFCIVGQFDIDFDGTADVRGPEAIAALVKRYGGEVVDHVDATTDYVVVGLEPPNAPSNLTLEGRRGAEEPIEDATASDESADEYSEDADVSDDEDESSDDEEDVAPDDSDDEDANADDADAEEDDASDDENSDDFDDEDAESDEEGIPAGDEDPSDDEPQAAGSAAAAPSVPTIARNPVVDPTRSPRLRRAMSERDRYDEAIYRARMFSIPRLPQDRFFNFVGLESGREAARALDQ